MQCAAWRKRLATRPARCLLSDWRTPGQRAEAGLAHRLVGRPDPQAVVARQEAVHHEPSLRVRPSRRADASSAAERPVVPASRWRTDQIYLAHAALTAISGRRHVMAERVSREALGMAGAATELKETRIFLNNWETVIAPTKHTLRMTDEAFDLALTLAPTKGPIPHGDEGYSRKGDDPEQASCYYSFPRMAATGRVRISGVAGRFSSMAYRRPVRS